MDTINNRLSPDVVEALRVIQQQFSAKFEALEYELECFTGHSNITEPSTTQANVLTKIEFLEKQISTFSCEQEKLKVNQKQNESRFNAMIEIFNRCLYKTQLTSAFSLPDNIGKLLSAEKPHFTDNCEMKSPIEFLEELENYFSINNIPELFKLHVAVSCLEGEAKLWASIFVKNNPNFCEFKLLFRNRYWSVEQQRSAMVHLSYGRYKEQFGQMAHYFLLMYKKISYLSSKHPLPAEEFIKLIADHYSGDVKKALLESDATTIPAAYMVLVREDELVRKNYVRSEENVNE